MTATSNDDKQTLNTTDQIRDELRTQNAPRIIDATPTWAGMMPAFFAILENGTDTGKAAARAELLRLAALVDAQNAAARTKAETDHRPT